MTMSTILNLPHQVMFTDTNGFNNLEYFTLHYTRKKVSSGTNALAYWTHT
jgi:hypothetical protein